MRIFKFITGGLVLLIIALFIYQNLATFQTQLPFSLDLFIKEKVTGQFSLYSLLIVAGLTGVAVGIFLMLKPYFNARRLLAQERQKAPAISGSHAPVEPDRSGTSPMKEDTMEQDSTDNP